MKSTALSLLLLAAPFGVQEARAQGVVPRELRGGEVKKAEVVPEDENGVPLPESGPSDAEEAMPDPVAEAPPEQIMKAEVVKEAEPAAPEEEAKEVKAVPEEEEAREVKAVPKLPPSPGLPSSPARPDKDKIAVSLATDPNARPVSLRVPAPRGLIVDREGKAFAASRMGHYMGISLPLQQGLTDDQVLQSVKVPSAWCKTHLGDAWHVDAQDILKHYHNRRWVPLMCDTLISEEMMGKIKGKEPAGVVLKPTFVRYYPENSLACHLLGYPGKSGSFTSGVLMPDEPMWPQTVGAAGLEKRFDKELSGQPGVYRALYDAEGGMLSEEWVQRPRAGYTVVTTMDLQFQKIVEKAMREHSMRGAFIIMDVRTGDLIAIASNPGYDLNNFAYGVSSAYYGKLQTDKETPLFCRSLGGTYPPASTFKIVTSLAALEGEAVDPTTYFNCPAFMKFGSLRKWNANNKSMGDLNVISALKFSCNTWMFQAARAAGGDALASMASRMGYGEAPGTCLGELEKPGLMPTPEFYMRKGGSMSGGVLANVSIGQGEVLATPVHVCQMMAAVARGDAVPRPRLVKQIQDLDGRIVQYFPPTVRNTLNISKENIEAVRKGMRAVVAGDGGTGSRGENSYVPTAAKTGTGEWKPEKNQYVVWFAGFLPYGNPEYAFAAIYEGDPGEDTISGGKKVAPIVAEVFNSIYRIKRSRGDALKAGKADDGEEEESEDSKPVASRKRKKGTESGKPTRQVTASATAPAAEEKKVGGLRGFFRRLRGKEVPR